MNGADFDERVTALLPYAQTGSDYIRAVSDNLRTARRMANEDRWDEAEYWLGEAEDALRRNGATA